MRWGRAAAAAVVVVALAACGGGGKKSNAAATGSSSNGSVVSVDSGASTNESGAAGETATGGGSLVADANNGGGDQGGGQQPGNTDAPAPSGLKPFAGKYAYHATGTISVNGPPSNVDAQVVTTIEDLNDADQRVTTAGVGGSGDQVQVLRYGDDRVDLLSLEMRGAVHKVFNGPVLFAPVPGSIGQAWSWDLTSTDALTHVHQSSHIDRTETVTIGGQSIDTWVVETDLTLSGDINGSGHLTTWVSTVYKVGVRNHSTLDATYATFHFTSDITAELLDLRPS